MSHANASHGKEAKMQFKCQACGASFNTKDELEAHGKASHAM